MLQVVLLTIRQYCYTSKEKASDREVRELFLQAKIENKRLQGYVKHADSIRERMSSWVF